MEAENPRLQLRLANLLREEAELQERLGENQHRIAARMRENEILRVQQESFILQARPRMGSGENWVGYHVLAHLALHKWFRQKNRPVPGFIIFDQPSQARYPPEHDAEGSLDVLKDEDQTAVLQLFKLISDAAVELAPNVQIIVMDHADLKQDWFEQAVVERWRGGKKLIPQSWIGTAPS